MLIFVLASFCSFEKSTEVSTFLKSSLYPLMSKLQVPQTSLPKSCPLSIPLSEDLLKPLLPLVKRESMASYECLECHKSFRASNQLQEHITNNHISGPGTCFAEFCEFLPCSEENELVSARCQAIMASCFPAEHLSEFTKLCEFKEVSIWDMELGKPWIIIASILFSVGCLVYYLIIWAEMEEKGSNSSSSTKVKHRHKHKHKLY